MKTSEWRPRWVGFLLGLIPLWAITWEVAENRRLQSGYTTPAQIEDCDDCGIIFVLETLPYFFAGLVLYVAVWWLAGRALRKRTSKARKNWGEAPCPLRGR